MGEPGYVSVTSSTLAADDACGAGREKVMGASDAIVGGELTNAINRPLDVSFVMMNGETGKRDFAWEAGFERGGCGGHSFGASRLWRCRTKLSCTSSRDNEFHDRTRDAGAIAMRAPVFRAIRMQLRPKSSSDLSQEPARLTKAELENTSPKDRRIPFDKITNVSVSSHVHWRRPHVFRFALMSNESKTPSLP